MSKEKDPALKTTMRSIANKDVEPEESKTADEVGEESTTDDPQSEEGEAESAESGEDDAEGADTEGDSSEDDESGERLEFYVDGEEETPKPAAKDKRGFAKLRTTVREQAMKIAEMERKLQAQSAPVGAPDPGPEPTEEDDDVQYDMAKLKTKYAKWLKDTEERAKKLETARQETQQLMDSYKAAKADFSKKVDDYEEAEQTFTRMFDDQRQDVLFRNCSNPHKVIFLLHQRPELMEKLSKSTSRDEIVRELVRLEVTVKERKVGTPPHPPKKISGNAGSSQREDPELERLRAKSAKDGNMKPVTDYLRAQQNKLRSQKERGK